MTDLMKDEGYEWTLSVIDYLIEGWRN